MPFVNRNRQDGGLRTGRRIRADRDQENEEAQVTWAPCRAGQLSDDARHTLGLQQRVSVPTVHIGEYTSPAKAASELTESRPEQCPRVEEPRHRGGNKRVHGEPIGWQRWRQPLGRAQRCSRGVPREPSCRGGRSNRGRRSRSCSHAGASRSIDARPTHRFPVHTATPSTGLPLDSPWAPRLSAPRRLRLPLRLGYAGHARCRRLSEARQHTSRLGLVVRDLERRTVANPGNLVFDVTSRRL